MNIINQKSWTQLTNKIASTEGVFYYYSSLFLTHYARRPSPQIASCILLLMGTGLRTVWDISDRQMVKQIVKQIPNGE